MKYVIGFVIAAALSWVLIYSPAVIPWVFNPIFVSVILVSLGSVFVPDSKIAEMLFSTAKSTTSKVSLLVFTRTVGKIVGLLLTYTIFTSPYIGHYTFYLFILALIALTYVNARRAVLDSKFIRTLPQYELYQFAQLRNVK